MSDERFAAVEALALNYEPEWETGRTNMRGHGSFVLLSGLAEERLSEAAGVSSASTGESLTATNQSSRLGSSAASSGPRFPKRVPST